MSAQVRVYGRANYSDPVVGTVLFTRTIIEVQWKWLALPPGLTLLTLLFVLAAAIYTAGGLVRHQQLGDALLLYGVSGRTVDPHTGWLVPEGQEGWEELREGGGEALVQIRETEGGVYRLKKV